MRKNNNGHNSGQSRPFSDRLWLVPFLASVLVTVTLFLGCAFGLFPPFSSRADSVLLDVISLTNWDGPESYSDESGVRSDIPFGNFTDLGSDSDDGALRIAYLITGTKGDGLRIRRTLQAVYHPRNQYILHLDLEAPPRERIELAMYVKGDPTFSQVENVRVIVKGNLVTYKGPTMISCTLHAVSILLKENLKWDWFINLSASDYPLMTQDDILHVFSTVPRDLNFIEHMKIAGWKLFQRGRPIVIDPGLYLSKKFDLVTTTERRDLPTAFELYTGKCNSNCKFSSCTEQTLLEQTIRSYPVLNSLSIAGSAWIMLTRSFLDYCIWGWDQLPRTVLMYYANFISSPEGYFHTVICNTDGFKNTVVGHDLHYISWGYPPKQHPLVLSSKDYDKMVKSGAPFARKFARDDKVLDYIDRELLNRSEGQFTPGAWCIGETDDGAYPCTVRGNDSIFRPGPGAERLKGLMNVILSEGYRSGSCSSLPYDQSKRKWVNRTVHNRV